MEITAEKLQQEQAAIQRQKEEFLARANQAEGALAIIANLLATLLAPPPPTDPPGNQEGEGDGENQ